MKIHHLNTGSVFTPARKRLVNHCVLFDFGEKLLVVDPGVHYDFHTRSEFAPLGVQRWLMPSNHKETRLTEHLKRLGHSREKVTDIVLTHLDYDRASALIDFPNARVHIFGPEYIAGMAPAGWIESQRYRYLRHIPRVPWVIHPLQGEKWFGFDALRPTPELTSDLYLVPLVGHTWGHCGVAFHDKGKWFLHAGDAYFHRQEMNVLHPKCPWLLSLYQRWLHVDEDSSLYNQDRLRKLIRDQAPEVSVFCSSDPEELRLQSDLKPDAGALATL